MFVFSYSLSRLRYRIGGIGKRKKSTGEDVSILVLCMGRLDFGHFSYIKLGILAMMHWGRH